MLIMDPELVREVLAKSYIYQKIPGNALTQLLARGLVSYDTHKWSKHRRLINPVFHLDKVKVIFINEQDNWILQVHVVPSEFVLGLLSLISIFLIYKLFFILWTMILSVDVKLKA